MARRSQPTSRPIATIDRGALTSVIGGRFTPSNKLDPVLLEGIQKLSEAIASVGQSLAAAKENSMRQMMQLFQQLRERQ